MPEKPWPITSLTNPQDVGTIDRLFSDIYRHMVYKVGKSDVIVNNTQNITYDITNQILPKAQIKEVAKSNAPYSDIQEAINSITDASSSKPYLVLIYPGVYDLGGGYLTQTNLNIIVSGVERNSVIITSSNPNQTILTTDGCHFVNLTVKNTASGAKVGLLALYNADNNRITYYNDPAGGTWHYTLKSEPIDENENTGPGYWSAGAGGPWSGAYIKFDLGANYGFTKLRFLVKADWVSPWKVYTSNDDVSWTERASFVPTATKAWYEFLGDSYNARYFKLVITANGTNQQYVYEMEVYAHEITGYSIKASSGNTVYLHNIQLDAWTPSVVTFKEYEIQADVPIRDGIKIDGVDISTLGTTSDTHIALTTAPVHGSTSAATASKLVHRDAAGRAAVVAPSVAGDIAIKSTVDAVQTDLDTHKTTTTGTHGVGAGTIAKVGDIAVDTNLSSAGQDAITKKHTQNTDTDLDATFEATFEKVASKDAVSGYAGLNASQQVIKEPASKAQASGLASLDATSKVVQNPTNATVTPTASKIPIADATGKLDGWVTGGGSGNVVGPASAVDSDVVEFDGITGKLVKDGALTHANVADAITKKHTQGAEHSNLALLETYTQTEANLADAITKKHSQNTDSKFDTITRMLIQEAFDRKAHDLTGDEGFGNAWIDTFIDNTGILAGSSSGYTYRGTPNYDVIVASGFPTQTGWDIDSLGWTGCNFRQIIPSSALSGSATKVRVVLRAATVENAKLDNVYIGHAAASGDAYDFDGNQAEVLFSGVSGVDITANSTATSDWVTFSLDVTKNLIVSFYCSTATKDGYRRDTVLSGFSSCYKESANEVGITNVTGYSTVGDTLYAVESVIGNATVISIAQTVTSTTTGLMVWEQTTGTGSITAYLTANGGTNWTEVTSPSLYTSPAGICFFKSVTGMVAGTNMQIKMIITGDSQLESWAIGY